MNKEISASIVSPTIDSATDDALITFITVFKAATILLS
jgi:hypothetical protein